MAFIIQAAADPFSPKLHSMVATATKWGILACTLGLIVSAIMGLFGSRAHNGGAVAAAMTAAIGCGIAAMVIAGAAGIIAFFEQL